MDIDTPQNRTVLNYLTRTLEPVGTPQALPPLPPIARPDEIGEAFHHLAHPEVMERFSKLASILRTDCRWIIHSRPALVHPESRTIFLLAIGTLYVLRLPPSLVEKAIRCGAFTDVKFTFGGEMMTQRDLGPGWVFGAWLEEELRWIAKAFDYVGRSGSTEAPDISEAR